MKVWDRSADIFAVSICNYYRYVYNDIMLRLPGWATLEGAEGSWLHMGS